jgi:hypothetical protein
MKSELVPHAETGGGKVDKSLFLQKRESIMLHAIIVDLTYKSDSCCVGRNRDKLYRTHRETNLVASLY